MHLRAQRGPLRGSRRLRPRRLGRGLRKALYNYMHGLGLDADVRAWFADEEGEEAPPRRSGNRGRSRRPRLPAPQVPPDLVANALGAG